ncbi:hypothetical protein ACFL4J_00515 [Candidatus Margulisiibacteriota bacterium]
MAKKKKNAQKKIIGELKEQLLVQAEALGIRERYTPLWFVEQKLLALKKILAEFYAERSNLEYELNMLGTDKKEILIKLEKLHAYIRKAETLLAKYSDKLLDMIDENHDLSENRKKLSCLNRTDVRAFA